MQRNPILRKICQYRSSLISIFKVYSNSKAPIPFLSWKQSFVETKDFQHSCPVSHANRNSFTNILLSRDLALFTLSSLQWTPTPPEAAGQLNDDSAVCRVPGDRYYLTCVSSFTTIALWEMPGLGGLGSGSSYPGSHVTQMT